MVSKVRVKSNNIELALELALKPLGGISNFVKKGERVFVKPNFNTSDPFPASSDPAFIQAVLKLISAQQPREIILGESPTYFGNSRKYFQECTAGVSKKGISNLNVFFLNEADWVSKDIPNGKYVNKASIPKILDRVDKIIYLPCCKTHALAKFTGALKLSVGLLKPIERLKMHSAHLQEKIAELSSIIHPDLVIMDARKCFINRGPSEGDIREPNLIMASKNRVELDIEGIKIIQSYPGHDLIIEAEKLPQVRRAQELGIF